MSRRGERFRRRSTTERARARPRSRGSPSCHRSTSPGRGGSRRACGSPSRRRRRASCRATARAPPRRGLRSAPAPEVRAATRTLPRSPRRRSPSAGRAPPRSAPPGEGGVAGVRRQRRVHRAGRLAKQDEPLDEVVALAGLERAQRELPAVAFALGVVLRDRERRLQRRADVRDPAVERRDRREAASR